MPWSSSKWKPLKLLMTFFRSKTFSTVPHCIPIRQRTQETSSGLTEIVSESNAIERVARQSLSEPTLADLVLDRPGLQMQELREGGAEPGLRDQVAKLRRCLRHVSALPVATATSGLCKVARRRPSYCRKFSIG